MANDLGDQVDRNLQHHQSLIALDQFLQGKSCVLVKKKKKKKVKLLIVVFFIIDTPNDRYSTDTIFIEDESLVLPPQLQGLLKGRYSVQWERRARQLLTRGIRSPPSTYTGPVSGDSPGVVSYRTTHLLL
jgi:hypothetical protein